MRRDGPQFKELCINDVSADSPSDSASREIVAGRNGVAVIVIVVWIAACSGNGGVGDREAEILPDTERAAQQAADIRGRQIARDTAREILVRGNADQIRDLIVTRVCRCDR